MQGHPGAGNTDDSQEKKVRSLAQGHGESMRASIRLLPGINPVFVRVMSKTKGQVSDDNEDLTPPESRRVVLTSLSSSQALNLPQSAASGKFCEKRFKSLDICIRVC